MKPSGGIGRAIEEVLSHPALFDLQQRFCNNYDTLRKLFSEELAGRGRRILDVGCSTGACADALLSIHDNDYLGVDLNERYLAYAKKRRPHGKFIKANGAQLDFSDASFDLIMLFGMLHHNPDDQAAACLAEAARLLRQGGAILIAEPVFDQDSLRSTLLLCLDRGRFIRCPAGYERLFGDLAIKRHGICRTVHNMAYYVLENTTSSQPPRIPA